MNDIQEKIELLRNNGWTVTALSERIGQARVTVDKWKSGERYPANPKAILILLDQVVKEKRIPKQRRYTKGSRTTTSSEVRENG